MKNKVSSDKWWLAWGQYIAVILLAIVLGYIVDFYCPKLKLAIEVDGYTHFSEAAQKYDKRRQRYIESFGIRFLRFTNTEVYENVEGVVQTIEEVCRSFQPPLAPP